MKWPRLMKTKASMGTVGGEKLDINVSKIWRPGSIVPTAVPSPPGYRERTELRHSDQSAYEAMWYFARIIEPLASSRCPDYLPRDAYFAVCAEYYRQSSLAFGNIRGDRKYLEHKIREHGIGLTVEDVENQMIYERDPLSPVFEVMPMFSQDFGRVFFYSFRQKAKYEFTWWSQLP